MFALGVVILLIALDLGDFWNLGSLFIKKRHGESLLSGQPPERSKKSRAKVYPQPQIHHRI